MMTSSTYNFFGGGAVAGKGKEEGWGGETLPHTHSHTHTHIHIYTHICTYIHIHVHIPIYIYISKENLKNPINNSSFRYVCDCTKMMVDTYF